MENNNNLNKNNMFGKESNNNYDNKHLQLLSSSQNVLSVRVSMHMRNICEYVYLCMETEHGDGEYTVRHVY